MSYKLFAFIGVLIALAGLFVWFWPCPSSGPELVTCPIPEYSEAPAPYFVANTTLFTAAEDPIFEGDTIQVKCLIVEEFRNAVCLSSGVIEPVPICKDVIYLIGGSSSNSAITIGNIGIFYPEDVGSSTMITSQSLVPHGYSTMGFVYQEKLYAVGGLGSGTTAEYFDVAENKWIKILDDMPAIGYPFGALIGSKYHLCGTVGCYNFDIDSHEWTQTTPMLAAVFAGCSFVIDNFWYLVGGQEGTTNQKIVQRYDPSTDSFSQETDYPLAIRLCGATSLNGLGYVCGGTTGYSTSACNRYDPNSKVWINIEPMQEAKYQFNMGSHMGSIYAFTGNGTQPQEVEKYDLNTGKWEILVGVADLIGKRYGYEIANN